MFKRPDSLRSMACSISAALGCLLTSAVALGHPHPPGAWSPAAPADYPALPTAPEPPPPCTEDCYLLSTLSLRGSPSTSLTFELQGVVRAKEEVKVPLFGPPGQVKLDDVTLNGARAVIGFDTDHYFVFTRASSFTVRGRITLGDDQMLSVPGPLVSLDAHLSKGRLIEGDHVSGLQGTNLHFDPMTEDEGGAAARQPKAPVVFRLSRALRFGRETKFIYRLVASQGPDLGVIRVPLKYGEKVGDVQGASGWSVDGSDLVLATSGHEADITVSGTMPEAATEKGSTLAPRMFTPDPRSAYEWWLVEADPEHRVAIGGEGKLVETSQSPITPSLPNPRVYLVQRGQQLEIDARSLVRGDVLAAVARTSSRFIAITGSGELINDETIAYENNGLDHLMLTPAGKAMYLSTDGSAQRILHTEAGAADVLVPVKPGSHNLRVQSLAAVRLWPLAGAITIPRSTYPLATSATEVTVGLPEHVHPLVVLGGDRVRTAFAIGDLIALALGALGACAAFRTKQTRVVGALVTCGLWFVSRDAFVVASATLFLAAGVFLASRFVRGMWLFAATGALTIIALLGGRFVLASSATSEPTREMFVYGPNLPIPEHTSAPETRDDPTAVTPVSLSFPTSERYVRTSRQLVTQDRPFVPRIVYVTTTVESALHVVWLVLLGLLAFMHRDRILALKAAIIERLSRRPDPRVASEAPPF